MPFTQITGQQIMDKTLSTDDFDFNVLDGQVLQDNTVADLKIVAVSAAKITVKDVENSFNADNVEAVLQEISAKQATNFTQLNQNIATAKTEIESQVTTEIEVIDGKIDTINNRLDGDIETRLSNLSNTKAAKNGSATENFNALNVTVGGNIIPTVNGTQDIGSSEKRFGTIWVNEAKLSTNTLYIGDTPVLGTNMNTIEIKADVDQGVSVSTKGAGLTTISSETGVTVSASGMNGDVKVQASGAGASVKVTATREVAIVAPSVMVTGDTAISGTLSTGGLTVNGNLAVTGSTTTINTQSLLVKDNIIEVNQGEVGSGVTAGKAGLKVDRGDAADYYIMFDEEDDMFKVGMAGQLENIASHNWVNAHMYVHPTTHPASIIVEETDKRFLKDAERTKIANVRQNQAGQANFAGLGGYVQITLPQAPADTGYFVSVTPCEATSGNLGEMWVEKSVGSFKVYNTGSSVNKFDWMVMY